MNDPFTAKLPHLDIHGETSSTCIAVINSFIKDCLHMKEYKCVIIHGRGIHGIGKGVLKETTKEYLKNDKRVSKYYIDGFNDGQTIVELKKE